MKLGIVLAIVFATLAVIVAIGAHNRTVQLGERCVVCDQFTHHAYIREYRVARAEEYRHICKHCISEIFLRHDLEQLQKELR